MKKLSLLLVLTLLLGLAACGQKEPVTEEPPAPEEPLRVETLAVEISKGGLEAQQLSAAVKELPEVLETYFAELEDVEIYQVTVTVGSSPSATAQALEEGHVDLAFLPAAAILENGGIKALLADAQIPRFDDDFREAGTTALLCAAPTLYGSQLAERSGSGHALTWDELANAHWGVSEAGVAYDCFDLWLTENFDGRRAAELPQVTLYEDDAALLWAALSGEVDAVVLRREGWAELEEAWTLPFDQTSAHGISGFNQSAAMERGFPMLAETETLCTQAAAVSSEREELAGARFSAALEQVLLRLEEERPELMAALGASHFAAAEDGDLDSARRLLTLEKS